MNYPCLEKTIEFDYREFKIRLWIDITKNSINISKINKILKKLKAKKEQIIISWLANKIPHINAVQVINKLTNIGEVAYTTAFNDNIHG
jgi:hypothetical protein